MMSRTNVRLRAWSVVVFSLFLGGLWGPQLASAQSGTDDILLVPGQNSISVRWNAPGNTTGNGIEYKVKYRQRVGSSWGGWVTYGLTIEGSAGSFESFNNWTRYEVVIPENGTFPCDTRYEVKVKRRGHISYRWRGETRTRACDSNKPDPKPKKPTLIFGADFISGNFTAPGLFRANTDGTITNYLDDNGLATQTTWGFAEPGSFARQIDGKAVYGVTPNGRVFLTREEDGLLVHWTLQHSETIHSNSLIWSNQSWSGNNTAPGIFAVDATNRIVNFRYLDGWQVRYTDWGGGAVPGSLMAGGNGKTVYGVRTDGKVCMTREVDGQLVYWVISPPSPIVPGSLVWGNDSWTGDETAPGFYGVDTSGKVINFRYLDGEFQFRTTDWGNAVPGSLVAHDGGHAIYGVNSNNRPFLVKQVNGELAYYVIDNSVEVVPGSLVWSTSDWAGDYTAPGLFGVDVNNNVLNFRWKKDAFDTRVLKTDMCAGSLVRDHLGYSIYGIGLDGTTRRIQQIGSQLIQFNLDD